MTNLSLARLSPLDGRYATKLTQVAALFCEDALIRSRIRVEVEYFLLLSEHQVIRTLTTDEKKYLQKLAHLDTDSFASTAVKQFEAQTHHDVKAIEYYLRSEFEKTTLKDCIPFIHFGLTSEDSNNLAYRLMLKAGLETVMLPQLRLVLTALADFSRQHSQVAMLARTHGQPAVPTTVGKEFVVFATRVLNQLRQLETVTLTGKCNGAVGNYQAMMIAYPSVDWPKLSQKLVENLGFKFSPVTTQINPPDDMVDMFAQMHHLNGILLDVTQDVWRYISDNWLVQKGKEQRVGSSTMPQKINPIEFENAEGNLLLANGLIEVFMRKLPISRLQRDLSESTVLRNIGTAIGYSSLAYQSLLKGLTQLAPNYQHIEVALHDNYAILLEAWQTCARTTGDTQAYEKAATLGKSQSLTATQWKALATQLEDAALAQKLLVLTPSTYIGLAHQITKASLEEIEKYLDSTEK